MKSARGALATLGTRAVSICAQLGFFVLVARVSSIEVVGLFAMASAFWVLARALLPMGWNVAVLRSVSVLRADGSFSQGKLILKAALIETALLGGGLGFLLVLCTFLVAQPFTLGAALASAVALLWAEIGILVSYLRAMGDLVWSQACDGVVVYVVPLLVCGALAVGDFPVNFDAIGITYLISALLSLSLLFAKAKTIKDPHVDQGVTNPAEVSVQRRLARRLWWNQAFSALSGRMSVLMAAPVAGVAATAIVETGLRTQLVGATLAWAGGTVASPRYAIAHEKSPKEGPRILNLVTWAAMLPSAGVVVLLMLWGNPILNVLGEAYAAERLAITIMAFAAVVELPAGSGGYFLMMTGRERAANLSSVLQLVVVLVLIGLLGPLMGATGIAVAVLIAAVVRTGVVLVALHRDRIPSPLGSVGLRTLASQIIVFLKPRGQG